MKKITSFLALMLLFICGASAQTVSTLDTETNLFTSVDQFYSPWTEASEGSVAALIDNDPSSYWHSQWTAGAVDAGVHYFQIEVADLPEEFGFTFTRRNVAGNQITEWTVYGVPSDNPQAEKDECTLLAEVETPCASSTETCSSPVLQSQGFTIIRFYEAATVGLNGGQSGKGFFHLAEFAINPVVQKSAIDVALQEAINVYMQYSTYSGAFEAGTNPGNYGVDEVTAFEAALTAAEILDTPEGNSLTVEQIQKLADDIKNTYDAIAGSRIPFATEVAEGYYFITAALDFKKETTTEPTEDPETGEEIPGETVTEHFTKAIYTDGSNGRWADLNRQDANFLWKVVKAGDKKYHLINCQNDNQFTKVATSGAITLSSESDSLVVFDYATDGVYNIRLDAQAEHDYFYLHCGGHGGGAGVQGNLVGWCMTYENGNFGASEWKLEAVDEATALAIIEACSPAKKIKAMEDAAAEIVAAAPAQIQAAEDKVAELDTTTPLITDASQLYSPMTTNDTQRVDGEYATDEQVMGFLLDGNTSTYWHSAWEGGDRPNGADYIQISGIDAENVAYMMTRRAVANDHITSVSVYGYDEANDELAKEAGELLASFNTPFTSNTEVITSPVIPTKGHSVLRVYAEMTTNSRGYWHMTEFQMYPANVSQPYATTQAEQRAAEVAALQKAIEDWKALDLTTVTDPSEIETQYNALAAAWEAWTTVFVNPADLRNAVKNVTADAAIKIGKNPGEWASTAELDAMKSTIAAANAYDATGKYTPAESEKYIAAIAAADSVLLASANKVQAGKWYRIRFGTEEEYDAAGWDKGPADVIMHEASGAETSHGLLGKYIVVARHHNEVINFTNAEGNNATTTQYNVEELDEDIEASFGANAAFMDLNDLSNTDYSLWQFVAIGDSAYVLQNKATGLYMRTGTTGAVTMNLHPSVFNTNAIGYGKSLIKAQSLLGDNNNYLHGERATSNLVTWNATAINSNSALYIEEVEDVTTPASDEFTMSVWPGQLYTMCYPVEMTAKDGTFYGVSIEGTTVTLSPMKDNTAAAGQPVVYIDGTVEDYQEIVNDKESADYNADAYELATFTHGTTIVGEAGKSGALVGCFADTNIEKGNLWAEKNSLVVTKKTTNKVGANTAYVEAGIEDTEAAIELIVSATEFDAIQDVISAVSKSGNIYTVDGKLAGKGNLNSVKNMNKGIYVINGVKVLVK